MKTIVLWVSRHNPLEEQLHRIEAYVPGAEFKKLPLFVNSAEELFDILKTFTAEYDKVIVIPILPLTVVKRLLDIIRESREKKLEVWWVEMREIHATYNVLEAKKLVEEDPSKRLLQKYGTKYKVYEFEDFHLLEEIKIVTRRLFAK